ncbi:MarR family winged helix-turn-helix transcriptional regulator [Marinococcus halotolerans]|uniref:MarR family winged helix-turn-helix transcriptional regulator n=1 Tax=Marinococcus halotolerans TaxID=301092 RepID=UPI0003B7A99D|nr:MarR family transcriptional regulator [Marinococcus halotolerans]
MNDSPLSLDHQLCFAVYACSKEISKMYREELDPLGLTFSQYLMMLVLWEEDHQSVKAIGEKLYLDSGTLTPMVKRMEGAGLVTRKRSTEDERIVLVHLTEQGCLLKHDAACLPERLGSRLGIDEEGAKQLLRQLHQITEHIQKGEN